VLPGDFGGFVCSAFAEVVLTRRPHTDRSDAHRKRSRSSRRCSRTRSGSGALSTATRSSPATTSPPSTRTSGSPLRLGV